MNILFVSAFAPAGRESGANRLRKLAKGLSANQAKVYWLHSGEAEKSPFFQSLKLGDAKSGKLKKIVAMIFAAGRWAKENEGIILVSMPPPWLILVAAVLGLRWRNRVWLDYRDPLLNQKINPRSFVFRFVVRFLDRVALANSAGAILAAPRISEYLPFSPKAMECIYAGVDPDEHVNVSGPVENTLLYGGTFYSGRSPVKLMHTLRRLSLEKSIPADFRIKLFAEFNDPADEEFMKNLLQDPALSFVQLKSLVTRAEFMREAAKAKSLLVITHDEGSEYAIPGKIFDYLTLKKPILAISRDRALKEFADEFQLAVTFIDEESESEFESEIVKFLATPTSAKEIQPKLHITEQAKKFLRLIK